MNRLCVGLALCVAGYAFGDDTRLGRLFLAPAERAALDFARQNSQPPQKIAGSGNDGKRGNAVAPRSITVQGFVKRGDGKGTVWVNGSPVQENSATGSFEVEPLRNDSDRVRIKLSGTGQTLSLKAGQRYDAVAGKVDRE